MDPDELPLECFLMLRREEAWTRGQTCGQAEMAPQVQTQSLPEESVLQARLSTVGARPSLCSRGPGRPMWQSLPLNGQGGWACVSFGDASLGQQQASR